MPTCGGRPEMPLSDGRVRDHDFSTRAENCRSLSFSEFASCPTYFGYGLCRPDNDHGAFPAHEGDSPPQPFPIRPRRVSQQFFVADQSGPGQVWPSVWLLQAAPPIPCVPCDSPNSANDNALTCQRFSWCCHIFRADRPAWAAKKSLPVAPSEDSSLTEGPGIIEILPPQNRSAACLPFRKSARP